MPYSRFPRPGCPVIPLGSQTIRAILEVDNALILRPRGFDAAGVVIVSQRCRRVVAQDDGSVERLVAGDQGHGRGQAGPEPVRAEGDAIMGLRPGPDAV